jgi:hypothetical protein
MSKLVCSGAMLQCSYGLAPAQFVVLPISQVFTQKKPGATIMDHKPTTNVMPFGMCTAPGNPLVIAAKGPVPCVPATTTPWTPGSPTIQMGGQMALNSDCQLTCMWSGVIRVVQPGQQTVNLP